MSRKHTVMLLAAAVIALVYFSFGVQPPATPPGVPATKVDAKLTPSLPAKPSLRVLGDSEFRLPRRSGFERPFAFSPDGALVAACNWEEVRIWTFPEGRLKHDLSDQISSDCISFSPDGGELLVLDRRENDSKKIVRFDVTSGKKLGVRQLEMFANKGSTHYSFVDQGRWLCAQGSSLVVWNTDSGKLQFQTQSAISGPRQAGSHGVLTTWNRTEVARYDLITGDRLSNANNYGKRINPICTPDGTLMAGYSTEDEGIIFWNTETNERVGGVIPIEEKAWRPEEATLSADGQSFVYWVANGRSYFDRKIAVFDIGTGDIISQFPPPGIYYVASPVISPDGEWVFPTGDRAVFTPINVKTGLPFRETPDHILPIESLSFTPDGSTLLVGSGDQCRPWDVSTGAVGRAFQRRYVGAVDNSRTLAYSGRNGGIQLLDIATGETERSFDIEKRQRIVDFQLGTDRRTFALRTSLVIRRWDIETGQVLDEWTIPQTKEPSGRPGIYPYGRHSFRGFVLGGTRLYRFDQVRPDGRLPDQSVEGGRYDLLLEDWTTQRVTNRLRIPYPSRFAMASGHSDQTLAGVMSEDWYVRNSKEEDPRSTYLMVWHATSGWEKLRVVLPRSEYHGAFSAAALASDGRLIATARGRTRLEIWNGFTGELIQQLETPVDLSVLEFSDDGSVLASGHIDGRVFLWDTRAAWTAALPKTNLTIEQAERCWRDLAAPGRAPTIAMQRLLGDPETAIESLNSRLDAATREIDPAKAINDLLEAPVDDAVASVREHGPSLLDELHRVLDEASSEEDKSRIEQLLKVATRPVNPTLRRRLLAISMVEQIGGEEARRILRRIAQGSDGAPETKAAAAALGRLEELPAIPGGDGGVDH